MKQYAKEMTVVDLEYDPSSLLPACSPERLRKFEEWMSGYWETDIRLPQAYVDHILRFHGGCPGKACFRMPDGLWRMIGRFFNFLEENLPPPLMPTWRQWIDGDIRLDYCVENFLNYEFWCLRLEMLGVSCRLPVWTPPGIIVVTWMRSIFFVSITIRVMNRR
jgi:hypothetical protein